MIVKQALVTLFLLLTAHSQNSRLKAQSDLDYLPRRYPDIVRSPKAIAKQNQVIRRMNQIISEYNLNHDEENLSYTGRARFINLVEVVPKAKGKQSAKKGSGKAAPRALKVTQPVVKTVGKGAV